MGANLYEQFLVLPGNLSNHLMITVIPLAIGVAISLPLSVLVVKKPRLRYPVLTTVAVIQTIPSLALLALMVPVLAAVGAVTARLFGVQLSALGFLPTVIALTLYSMLPMVRNTVTGISEIEPAVIEAARGVGMTPRQMLWRVELPLAAPMIIAGIRTATVWVVGIATLATPVGQRCLGNYIFTGLQTRNWAAVMFGCVAAALLAIALDLLIGGVERAFKEGRRGLGLVTGGLLAISVPAGLAAPSMVRWMASTAGRDHPAVVWVGCKTFSEQYILSRLISDVLEAEGFAVRQMQSLGSTVIFDALVNDEIQCYVDYSGTIWANHMGRTDSLDSESVLREMTAWLEERHGVRCLGSLGFENAYGLAMRREQAEQWGIHTIGDLKAHTRGMKIGGDYEFFGRPEWRTIRDAYGLAFAVQISFDSTFMYEAVAHGEVHVISAFTSDGRIAAYDLTILDDPLNAIPPYDAVLLLSPGAARRADLVGALQPLLGAIPIEVMREANHQVDRDVDKRTVYEAARWLRERLSGEPGDDPQG